MKKLIKKTIVEEFKDGQLIKKTTEETYEEVEENALRIKDFPIWNGGHELYLRSSGVDTIPGCGRSGNVEIKL